MGIRIIITFPFGLDGTSWRGWREAYAITKPPPLERRAPGRQFHAHARAATQQSSPLESFSQFRCYLIIHLNRIIFCYGAPILTRSPAILSLCRDTRQTVYGIETEIRTGQPRVGGNVGSRVHTRIERPVNWHRYIGIGR